MHVYKQYFYKPKVTYSGDIFVRPQRLYVIDTAVACRDFGAPIHRYDGGEKQSQSQSQENREKQGQIKAARHSWTQAAERTRAPQTG